MHLECPSCGSADVDVEARECRACKIGLPDGSSLRGYITNVARWGRKSTHGQGRGTVIASGQRGTWNAWGKRKYFNQPIPLTNTNPDAPSGSTLPVEHTQEAP